MRMWLTVDDILIINLLRLFLKRNLCSLPVESGEETRKRKRSQSMRHMEGLKRRPEKERIFRHEIDEGARFMREQPFSRVPSSQWSIGSQGSAGSSGITTDLENQSTQGLID